MLRNSQTQHNHHWVMNLAYNIMNSKIITYPKSPQQIRT